jgi:hypothetical protein
MTKTKTIRLTGENAHLYLGREVIFRTYNKDTLRWNHVVRRILRTTNKSIGVEYPALNNQLDIHRAIYVLVD